MSEVGLVAASSSALNLQDSSSLTVKVKDESGMKKRHRAVAKFTQDEFMAAAIGDTAWLKQSLKGGKDPARFDKNGLAPIHLASLHGRLDCLKLLVEKYHVDVNLASTTGWCPLHLAINSRTGKRGIQCLQYLLDNDADPSVVNDDKLTPAHQAAIEGSEHCLEALIKAGANINLTDENGHVPLDYAKIWGHRKCARMLASEGWKQDKDIQAFQLKKLKQLKQSKQEDDQIHHEARQAEKDFFGTISFTNWLGEKGLPKKPTGPTTFSQCRHEENESMIDFLKKENLSKDGLYKTNSMRKSPQLGQKLSKDIQISSKTSIGGKKNQSVKGSIAGKGNTPKPATLSPPKENLRVTLPETTDKKNPKSAVTYGDTSELSELPQYMIDRILLEKSSPHDRPLDFKCRNIIDAQHRRLYDESLKPLEEVYAHLSNDATSKLFPGAASGNSSQNNNLIPGADIDRLAVTLGSWSKPDRFPPIKGKGFKYDFEIL